MLAHPTDNGIDPMLTLADAAEYAGCHVKTIRRKIAEGHLAAVRMTGGRSIRIQRSELDKLFRAIPTTNGAA